MQQQFKTRGLKGLGVALAKGVAALDHLGSYCFIGFPKALIGSVLQLLGAINAIKRGVWLFINPRMLSLKEGDGDLNLA